MSSTARAKNLVENWLHGEHDYQFNKNKVTHNADPGASLAYIVDNEIRNKWERFQLFDRAALVVADSRTHLQANQQILKACGAARGALVWSYVINGSTMHQANDETWNDISEYYTELDTGVDTLPNKELLISPIEKAIKPASITPAEGTYDVRPIFTQLTGLTIVHLLEQEERLGAMILPKPGTTSGDIEPWVV